MSNRVFITDNKKGAPLFENRKRVKWKGENKEKKKKQDKGEDSHFDVEFLQKPLNGGLSDWESDRVREWESARVSEFEIGWMNAWFKDKQVHRGAPLLW